MKNILLLHGSSDMYGSGKMFLSTSRALKNYGYNVVCMLPYSESLDEMISASGIEVVVGDIAVMRRQNLNFKGIINLFKDIFSSLRAIKELDKKYSFDLIYTNTSVVLSGAIYSVFKRKKHIWHVHEIFEEPGVFAFIMPKLIISMSVLVIANSNATKKYLLSSGKSSSKVKLVYNGVPDDFFEFKSGERDIVSSGIKVGMIGRFNRLKGQEVFVRAARELINDGHDIKFIIAGSAFRNEIKYEEALRSLVSESGLKERVSISGFIDNVKSFYDDIDILVVPTVQKESFGLVAAEAMSRGKAVIASNIGGLPEVVADKETGLLFAPGSYEDLKNKIGEMANNPGLIKLMGEKGRERARKYFREDKFCENIVFIVDSILEDKPLLEFSA